MAQHQRQRQVSDAKRAVGRVDSLDNADHFVAARAGREWVSLWQRMVDHPDVAAAEGEPLRADQRVARLQFGRGRIDEDGFAWGR